MGIHVYHHNITSTNTAENIAMKFTKDNIASYELSSHIMF